MDHGNNSHAGQGDARAQFEAWAHAQSYRGGNIITDRDADHPDVYACPNAQLTWQCWKAALAARQPVAAAVKDCLTVGGGQAVGQEPVAVLVPGAPARCKHCESIDLEWFAHVLAVNDVPHGRLTTHDVGCVFVLGCNECSETLHVVKADAIAALLATAPTAPTAQAVGLAENMLSVLIEEGVLARNGRVFKNLRALIDSQAVRHG